MSHYVFCVNIRQFLCRTPEEGSRKVALLAFWAGAIFRVRAISLVSAISRAAVSLYSNSLTRSLYSSPDTLPTLSRTRLRRLPSSSPAFFVAGLLLAPRSPPPTSQKKIRTPNEVRISCVVLYYPTISNLRSSMQRS